jgi:hypothetical protein
MVDTRDTMNEDTKQNPGATKQDNEHGTAAGVETRRKVIKAGLTGAPLILTLRSGRAWTGDAAMVSGGSLQASTAPRLGDPPDRPRLGDPPDQPRFGDPPDRPRFGDPPSPPQPGNPPDQPRLGDPPPAPPPRP